MKSLLQKIFSQIVGFLFVAKSFVKSLNFYNKILGKMILIKLSDKNDNKNANKESRPQAKRQVGDQK